MRRACVLGGYGRLGRAVAEMLLRETDVDVVIAGRNRDKAGSLAAALAARHSGERVAALAVDAGDSAGLAAAIRGVDMLIVCTTGSGNTAEIVAAALTAGVDCLDLRYPQEIAGMLRAFNGSMNRMGTCFFTQAGHFPGLASVLIRHAAAGLGRLANVTLATGMRVQRMESRGAAEEMVDVTAGMRSEIWADGAWRPAGIRDSRRIHFGSEFGSCRCYPICLEELRGLPERFGIGEMRLYVAGMNRFVDMVVMPAVMLAGNARLPGMKQALAGLLRWGANSFAKPPFGAVFTVAASGAASKGAGKDMWISMSHGDSYRFAAAAAVAGLLQYRDRSIGAPGLRLMGHEVDTGRLLADMRRFGVTVEQTYADAVEGTPSAAARATYRRADRKRAIARRNEKGYVV